MPEGTIAYMRREDMGKGGALEVGYFPPARSGGRFQELEPGQTQIDRLEAKLDRALKKLEDLEEERRPSTIIRPTPEEIRRLGRLV